MKIQKLITVTAISVVCTGCATNQPGVVQVGPYKAVPGQMVPQPVVQMIDDPGMFAVNQVDQVVQPLVTQPINDPFILADQVNQVIGGVMGPNNVSGAILQGQNWYRTGAALINNPWFGITALRNQWVN
jgi:hypothetical protein